MSFVFDIQMFNLGIGLIGLIIINILLGSITSIIEKKFDKAKFLQGLVKGLIVTISFVGVYEIGALNPNIIVINANGQDLNLMTGIYIIVFTGFAFYAKQVFSKLATFVNGNFEVAEQPTSIQEPTQPIQ